MLNNKLKELLVSFQQKKKGLAFKNYEDVIGYLSNPDNEKELKEEFCSALNYEKLVEQEIFEDIVSQCQQEVLQQEHIDEQERWESLRGNINDEFDRIQKKKSKSLVKQKKFEEEELTDFAEKIKKLQMNQLVEKRGELIKKEDKEMERLRKEIERLKKLRESLYRTESVSKTTKKKTGSSKKKKKKRRLIMKLVIDIDRGRSDSILIHEGDDFKVLAMEFIQRHNLKKKFMGPIVEQIKFQVKKAEAISRKKKF